MAVALGAAGILALLIALYGLDGETGEGLTRRAWARLAILAATGLSFFPGCGGEGPPPTEYEPPEGLLRKWARLGRIWRELSGHRHGACLPYTECRLRFIELGQEMTRALEALPAWPELSVVFEKRWAYLFYLWYPPPTCYPPPVSATCVSAPPDYLVEQQVEELERLVEEQRLSKAAGLRAAQVIAVQAERMRVPGAGDDIQPGPPALLAGQRLTELTASKLGWLAGPPRKGEGLPPTNSWMVGPSAVQQDDS